MITAEDLANEVEQLRQSVRDIDKKSIEYSVQIKRLETLLDKREEEISKLQGALTQMTDLLAYYMRRS